MANKFNANQQLSKYDRAVSIFLCMLQNWLYSIMRVIRVRSDIACRNQGLLPLSLHRKLHTVRSFWNFLKQAGSVEFYPKCNFCQMNLTKAINCVRLRFSFAERSITASRYRQAFLCFCDKQLCVENVAEKSSSNLFPLLNLFENTLWSKLRSIYNHFIASFEMSSVNDPAYLHLAGFILGSQNIHDEMINRKKRWNVESFWLNFNCCIGKYKTPKTLFEEMLCATTIRFQDFAIFPAAALFTEKKKNDADNFLSFLYSEALNVA